GRDSGGGGTFGGQRSGCSPAQNGRSHTNGIPWSSKNSTVFAPKLRRSLPHSHTANDPHAPAGSEASRHVRSAAGVRNHIAGSSEGWRSANRGLDTTVTPG